MSDVTRRDAFKVLATGAALATGASAMAAESEAASTARTLALARQLAAAVDAPLPPGVPSHTALATVHLCRSWDQRVYLCIDERVHGFATVDAGGLALAAACQAARRPVAVRYWGHDPAWQQVGRFDGVLLAVDLSELLEDPDRAD